MKRWTDKEKRRRKQPAIDAFLKDIEDVCLRHNLSITHEDGHGAFQVEMFDEDHMNWLRGAHDNR